MLKQIHAALTDGEQASFIVQRSGDDVIVTLVPRVGGDDAAAPSEGEQALRVALALPLRLKGNPEDLDQTLVADLGKYAELRSQVSAENDTLRALREAAAKADEENAKARKKAGKAKTEAQDDDAKEVDTSDELAGETDTTKATKAKSEVATPAPAPAAENPTSLF